MTTTINLLANNPSGQRVGLKRVQVGDSVIEYRVQRSRRRKKTIQISVNDDGVVVAAPARTPDRELQDVVLRRAAWIIRRLAERKPAPEPPRWVSGERLLYRGRSVKLAVEAVESMGLGRPEVLLDGNLLRVAVPGPALGVESQERVREAITAWYLARVDEQVRDEVERWWPALGSGDYPRIYIRNQRRRWGSCARDGALRFNWRLAMLEPSLTEYVVVHELAHRTHMNHSADFWNLVAAHLPDVKERRQRLKAAGAVLPSL